jgi:hypothetical protein
MTGGSVRGDLQAHDNTSGFISGGTVAREVITFDKGSVTIRGGGKVIGGVKAMGQSSIKIMGGHVTGLCRVYDDGQIYFLRKHFL